MRGHGGNRGDRQKREEPIDRGFLSGVDGGKNVVDRGHLSPLLVVACDRIASPTTAPGVRRPTVVLSMAERTKRIGRRKEEGAPQTTTPPEPAALKNERRLPQAKAIRKP